jgi:hypothetical protein
LEKSKVSGSQRIKVEDWRNWSLKKLKFEEVKYWSLKKSKNWWSRRLKFWDSTRVCNSNWVSGATDEGMPFRYPRISILGPAH